MLKLQSNSSQHPKFCHKSDFDCRLRIEQPVSLDALQQNLALQRKLQLEEERKKDLLQRIQAKDEKIQILLEQKKQEKDIREHTYEDRRERFKNEVKERREIFQSCFQVKGRNSGCKASNSIHRKCLQQTSINQNQNSDFSPISKNQGYCQQNSLHTVYKTCESPDRRISRNSGTSEARLSRKIHVNQDEEDEAPLPLDVRISPIKNQDQFQYEL